MQWILENNIENKIAIPHKYKNEMYLSDFYFAANFNVLKEYYEILSAPGSSKKIILSENPHLNGIIKYAYEKYSEVIKLPLDYFSDKKTYQLSNIYIFMMNYAFISMPFVVYENLKWRGEELTNSHIEIKRNISTEHPLVYIENVEESGEVLINKLIIKIRRKLLNYTKFRAILF